MERVDVVYFEALERAARLYYHVRKSLRYSNHPLRRPTAQLAIADHVLNVLLQNIKAIIETYHHGASDLSVKLDALKSKFHELAIHHQRLLLIVPRPGEPIELVSFLRQAQRSNSMVDGTKEHRLLVFATELLGDQAHANFNPPRKPQYIEAVTAAFEELPGMVQSLFSDGVAANQATQPADMPNGYVSLPRIDLGNPLRWPSLLHEMAHFDVHPDNRIWKDFLAWLPAGAIVTLRRAIAIHCSRPVSPEQIPYPECPAVLPPNVDQELQSWLVECWCDARATKMCGAATFFAQAQAFSFSVPCYMMQQPRGLLYPPAWFRLRIIKALVATRRFESPEPDLFDVEPQIDELWREMQLIFPDQCSFKVQPELQLVFDWFRRFLGNQFPASGWAHQSKIDLVSFNRLVQDLEAGFPIPAVDRADQAGQRAATHAEILVAGWKHRSGEYRTSLMDAARVAHEGSLKDVDLLNLTAVVERADVVLQASIQSSEWFSILSSHSLALNAGLSAEFQQAEPVPFGGAAQSGRSVSGPAQSIESVSALDSVSLLTDHEIKALLATKELRIIPGVNSDTDVSGSVIDLRLGHNFEVFFPKVRGAYDAMRKPREEIASMEVDFDSLDGLELMPGQFVLAHTLEFLSLPERVAGQIEGRSSFARLGIQVHMTANLVEAGFQGCLTLEIANHGHSAVKLYPGLRIAQIRLFGLKNAPEKTYNRRGRAKFRGMLRHGRTRQFDDWELDALHAEKARRDAAT